MKQVWIVVDMQEDFVTGVLGSQEAQAVVEPIRQEVARYREETSQESRHIPCHCVKGEAGWRILSQLDPKDSPVVEKPSFLCLELPRAIGPLEPEDVIALCGVCTDICVVSNALYLRARYPDNPIVVLEKLCAGTSEENHKAALAVMKSCLIEVR